MSPLFVLSNFFFFSFLSTVKFVGICSSDMERVKEELPSIAPSRNMALYISPEPLKPFLNEAEIPHVIFFDEDGLEVWRGHPSNLAKALNRLI